MAFGHSSTPFTLAKYLLFGLNFLIFTFGILLLSLSLWVRSDSGLWVYTENLTLSRYYWACYMGMGAGSLLLLVSFMGCMGTLLESRLLVATFTFATIVAIVLEIILLIFVWRIPGGDRLQNELSHELKYHIENMDYSARSRDFLDLVQLKLQCCGAYSFVDYKNMQLPVPQSCSNELTNNINYRSCGEMLRRYLEIRGGAMGGFALSLLLLQFILLALSIGFNYVSKQARNTFYSNQQQDNLIRKDLGARAQVR